MPSDSLNQRVPTILLIAASRGLGLAMAAEFLKKGWNVVGTLRSGWDRTKLHDLADEFKGRVEIEPLGHLRASPGHSIARALVWQNLRNAVRERRRYQQ